MTRSIDRETRESDDVPWTMNQPQRAAPSPTEDTPTAAGVFPLQLFSEVKIAWTPPCTGFFFLARLANYPFLTETEAWRPLRRPAMFRPTLSPGVDTPRRRRSEGSKQGLELPCLAPQPCGQI